MNASQARRLSDRELLVSTQRAAQDERQAAAALLALLGELDDRRLYLGEGCSSLFTYCTQVLHLSEYAAYHRIEVARLARQFPIVLELVASGDLTLTNAALLRAHLTIDNHRALLAAARHKSKREVEHQIACLAPRPDSPPVVRRFVETRAAAKTSRHARAVVAATASDRYLLRVTISADAHAKLRKAQDLLRHSVPNGDPSAIIDRALTLLVEQLERAKTARASRPRQRRPPRSRKVPSRYIPADVRRTVWQRDRGQCAFVGAQGRCRETGRLEFHHIVPFSDGGATDVANLSLRCQAHNGYESQRWATPAWRDHGAEAGPAPP